MYKMQTILEKIIKITGKKISYEEIGKAIGTSKQNVGFLVKNNSQIPDKRIKEIEEYFKINLTEVKEKNKLSREEKLELAKSVLKEEFDINDKEYELIFKTILSNKELTILLAKALNGDSVSKQFIRKMFDD